MTLEKPTILIVDDEIQNIRVLSEFLKNEFRIIAATNGEGSLFRANAIPQPDAILLDIMMPDMDGYEVCRRLKADKATTNIPIIFMSAMVQLTDEIKGLELGAVDYITKPYSLPIVRSRLQTHVRLKQARFDAIRAARFAAAGQLAAGIAHEINTPLQYIASNIIYIQNEVSELINAIKEGKLIDLQAACAESELQEAIIDLRRGVSRISDIVLATKDFCSQNDAEMQYVDINNLINNVLLIGVRLIGNNHHLDVCLDSDLPPISCHPGRMSEVIMSLIQNAVQAVLPERNGDIRILTKRHGDWAEIHVMDNGAGIPPEIRDHIFDPFFTTRDVGFGQGLGLAIVYDTITKLGGTISVKDGPAEGSVFTIRLPVDGSQTETPNP
ncbi:putative Response regulator receiver sensor signal transduction histidine kinase [Magnetospirillum sp. XM-1]|uniref:hybrid sensor histidine kinase/response regulator n=1 Tax=Magnetospirillum sp. XM-1 TaxID=1663591 RepID=UPI00073DF821|nr:ATP-binding protein [Magnetospirillum sp. XM-1]CUW41704.1 putative Response regulator receiver sensor signal transduction histidine kinase [Magnetospirillum sp. XM-1]